jgi:hypothetical protein
MDIEHRTNDKSRYNDPIADPFHEGSGRSEGGTIDVSESQVMPEYVLTVRPMRK